MPYFKQNYFQKRTRPKGPRINDRIRAPEVQVINSEGKNLGTLRTEEAIKVAIQEAQFIRKLPALLARLGLQVPNTDKKLEFNLSGVTITGASGGSAEANGFNVTSSNYVPNVETVSKNQVPSGIRTGKASKIQVLSIAQLMAEAIKRISNSTSVSSLFN